MMDPSTRLGRYRLSMARAVEQRAYSEYYLQRERNFHNSLQENILYALHGLKNIFNTLSWCHSVDKHGEKHVTMWCSRIYDFYNRTSDIHGIYKSRPPSESVCIALINVDTENNMFYELDVDCILDDLAVDYEAKRILSRGFEWLIYLPQINIMIGSPLISDSTIVCSRNIEYLTLDSSIVLKIGAMNADDACSEITFTMLHISNEYVINRHIKASTPHGLAICARSFDLYHV